MANSNFVFWIFLESFFFSILNLQLFEPVDVETTDMWDQFYSNDLWFKDFTHANLL